jgi:formate hydrogenlyase transcriptional activator
MSLRTANKKAVATGQGRRDENRHFERLVADLSGAFVRAAAEEIDDEINRWLRRIVLALGLDRSTVAQIDPHSGSASFSHGWAREEERVITNSLDANAMLPWLRKKMLAGETVVFSSLDELPEEAGVDRESMRVHGPKSNVTMPIKVGGVVVGAVGFGALYRERRWPPEIVGRLRLVADVLGYALERKRTRTEMLRLRDELAYVSRVTTLGQLAASIAHELNQPLAAILTNAQAAQRLLGAA